MPIYKHNGSTWLAISALTYMDGATPRSITNVFYNDNLTERQVFGAAVAAETLAWDASAPTGTYTATTTEPGGTALARFSITTTGTFNFTLIGLDAGGTGTPLTGTFRPGVTGVDLTSYEVSVTMGPVAGSGIRNGNGSMSDITGTFQPLSATGTVSINLIGSGSGTVSVSVEIREIATPANTTGVAAFTLGVIVP